MPLFAFQVGIGFKKTSSKKNYFLRMLLVAIISQIPYALLCNNFYEFNICFTFAYSMIILYFIELSKNEKMLILPAIFLVVISIFLPIEYNLVVPALVILAYLLSDKKLFYSIGMVILSCFYAIIKKSFVTLFMIFALPIILLFNGKKGRSFKYAFYLFYPIHILALYLIKTYLL